MASIAEFRLRCGRFIERLGGRVLVGQAASFALIGVVNTLVDFGVFLLAITYLTASLIAANVLSWTVAVTGSYALNSFVTFAAESGRRLRLRAYLGFVGSGIAGLIANTATLLIAAKLLLLPVVLAKVLAIGASFVVNFSLARFVVFRTSPSHRTPVLPGSANMVQSTSETSDVDGGGGSRAKRAGWGDRVSP